VQARHFRWIFLAALTLPLALTFSSSPGVTFGASLESTNGNYHFAGGTNLWLLIFSLLIVGLYLLLMYSSVAEGALPLPGVFRRYVSFWLDFMLAIFAVAPIVGLIPTFTEWRRTGEFAWNFERTDAAPGDGWLAALCVLLMFAALIFYFAWPLLRRRPSPGACIAGYQVIADDGVRLTVASAVGRTLLGFISLCCFYIAPFIGRDRKRGKFWLDRFFGTRAVRLR
jgi:uncharacterized RDD family membrane protein YckC